MSCTRAVSSSARTSTSVTIAKAPWRRCAPPAQERGFDVVAAPTHGEGERWSSTSVRAALAEGDLDEATSILGRPFVLRGVVVHGDERGARARISDGQPRGRQRSGTAVRGRLRRRALARGRLVGRPRSRSGTRPQFYDDGALLVEVHVLGYEGDLYGQRARRGRFSRVCAARRPFADVEALIDADRSRREREPSNYLTNIRLTRRNC